MSTYLRGENLRLFVAESASSITADPIALATKCDIHVQAKISEMSTKDDASGLWRNIAITGMSWEGTAEALIGETPSPQLSVGQTLFAKFNTTTGAMNRQVVSLFCQGQCVVTDLQIVARNEEYVTYACKLTGTGPLTTSNS